MKVRNQFVYTFISSRMSVTNQYKAKYVTGNISWALQRNALAGSFVGNGMYFERREKCMFYPKNK